MFKADFWPLAAIDSVGQLISRVRRSLEGPEEQNVFMSKQAKDEKGSVEESKEGE